MRWKIPAGALLALAFLIPAAPAVAHTPSTGPSQACQTAEPKLYKDIRKLSTIDLDTATDVEVRVLANQILAVATAESLPGLPQAVQARLDGTADDLRAFLKSDVQRVWSLALRVSVGRTLTGAGARVQAAAQRALSAGTIDAYLTYLNKTLYWARSIDCASELPPASSPQPTTSGAAPSATTVAPNHASTGDGDNGDGGGLPVTGAGAATAAGIGGALLLVGGAIYLIGRRRRSHFVA